MSMHFSRLLVGAVLFLTGSGYAKDIIDWKVIRDNTRTLSSDAFEGRSPGTPGEVKTIAHIIEQFRKAGLQPGNNGSWTQDVPIVAIETNPAAKITFAGGTTPVLALTYSSDMVIWTKRQVQSIGINNSSIVFVGYGINAPEWQWNDYAGLDVRGKTVIILVNDPGFATEDPKLFNGKAMTYYGRWTYKYEEAARQGAGAALIVHDTAAASYPWGVLQTSKTGPQVDIDYTDKGMSRAGAEGWITSESATRMFARTGFDFAALKAAAARRGFKPVPLLQTMNVTLSNTIQRSISHNVVGLLPGRTRPDQNFLYSAHWDHLGRCKADATGDDICNGAVDNASGVAGLISLADAYSRQKIKPARSILFVAFTAEESGLLGSHWLAQNPVVPLSKIVAGINMDGLNFVGKTEDVIVVGKGKSELEDYLAIYAARQKRVVEPEDRPEAGSFFRSDHFPLAKVGVPMLYADGGTRVRGKPADYGRKLAEAYTANQYHKPSDEFSDTMDFKAAVEDVTLFFNIGNDIANSTAWPNWLPTSEFRAARDASMAATSK
jgi:Zn-dependent M28 family amino/carboxypeptidase